MIALGRGLEVKLALGAGKRGQGGRVGLAQRTDLEQRIAADRYVVGLAGHTVAEVMRVVACIDGHSHAGDALFLHERADDLVDLGL
ncbi:hypothetical protein D3C75_1130300 [compost metagenome]